MNFGGGSVLVSNRGLLSWENVEPHLQHDALFGVLVVGGVASWMRGLGRLSIRIDKLQGSVKDMPLDSGNAST